MKTLILCLVCFTAINLPVHLPFLSAQPSSHYSGLDSPITFKIIPLADHTFGYDIFSGSHRMIHQSSVPGLPGNNGFRRKKDAQLVAELVIEKLIKKIMPPTVTLHEMDSLEVSY